MSTSRFSAVRALGIAGIALSAALIAPGVALADTAQTPVGQLTSTFLGCNDNGAEVLVVVSGGLPNTAYAASTALGFDHEDTFTTNASGNGQGYFHNAWPDAYPYYYGTAVITVTASGLSGTVPVLIECVDPKGE